MVCVAPVPVYRYVENTSSIAFAGYEGQTPCWVYCIASSSVHTPGAGVSGLGEVGAMLAAGKGVNVETAALPLAVIAKALLLLSMIVGLWHVSKLVFAVGKSCVGGVKLDVYNAVVLEIRTFEIKPFIL